MIRAYSSIRKIFSRSASIWLPQNFRDTSTGDGQQDILLNALNWPAANQQQNAEALYQLILDFGIDPESGDFTPLAAPLLSAGQSDYVLNLKPRLTFDWQTTANHQTVTDAEKIDKIGITEFRGTILGRPVLQTTPVYVSSVVSSSGFTVDAGFHISGPDSTAWCYICGKETADGGLQLIAYISLSWLPNPASILDDDVEPLFTVRWDSMKYDDFYFYADEATGSQTSAQYQLYIKDIRDYAHPSNTHPQFNAARGTVMLYRPHSFIEFERMFIKTDGHWIGRQGCGWEGWRVLDGYMNLPDMGNRFPMGWNITDADGSEIHVAGGSITAQTAASADATVSVTTGAGNTVAVSNHTHEFTIRPEHHTFIYVIKS